MTTGFVARCLSAALSLGALATLGGCAAAPPPPEPPISPLYARVQSGMSAVHQQIDNVLAPAEAIAKPGDKDVKMLIDKLGKEKATLDGAVASLDGRIAELRERGDQKFKAGGGDGSGGGGGGDGKGRVRAKEWGYVKASVAGVQPKIAGFVTAAAKLKDMLDNDSGPIGLMAAEPEIQKLLQHGADVRAAIKEVLAELRAGEKDLAK